MICVRLAIVSVIFGGLQDDLLEVAEQAVSTFAGGSAQGADPLQTITTTRLLPKP